MLCRRHVGVGGWRLREYVRVEFNTPERGALLHCVYGAQNVTSYRFVGVRATRVHVCVCGTGALVRQSPTGLFYQKKQYNYYVYH